MKVRPWLRPSGRFLRNVLLGCVPGVLVLLVAAIAAADRLIFRPPQALEPPPGERVTILPDGFEPEDLRRFLREVKRPAQP